MPQIKPENLSTRLDDPSFTPVARVLAAGKGRFKVRGWIKRKRDQKGKIFFVFRDASGEMQVVVDEARVSKEDYGLAGKLQMESSVFFEGEARADERAPGGAELHVSSVTPVWVGKEFPIQKDLSEDFLLDVRHLWLRSGKMGAALRVRAGVHQAFRDFMAAKGYREIHNPSFVSGAVEGGSTLFEVPYFGKKVFLTQSGQFYNEAYVFGLERIWGIAPSFRAEKSRTRRHLTEFWHAEMEAAWMQLPELIDFCQEMVVSIAQDAREKFPNELKLLGRDPNDLKRVDKPFERFTYRKILEAAKEKFPDLRFGSDLGEAEEREITKDFTKPIVVTHYPASLKPFYHRPNPADEETVLCCDFLAPEGYGEIIGGGERCWTLDEVVGRMKAEKLDPKAYEWYLDLRRYGAVPHSGFGLGLERLTTWLCKLPHIREVIGFPRTMNRFYP